MYRGLLLCVVVILCSSFVLVVSEETSYSGHQVWRVVPPSNQILRALQEVGDTFKLEFWKDPVVIGRAVDFHVSPDQIKDVNRELESRGIIDYQVYIPDIQVLIDQQKTPKQKGARSRTRATGRSIADFDYTVYHPAEEVYEWIDMVVNEYPAIVTKVQIGVTYQGRSIFALEFKKRPAINTKPVIFVDSLIHCREWITTASLMFIFKEMLRNPEYAQMIEEADWYFIPMINVDGYVETWTGDRLWRKTRSTGPSSVCTGTDGNRNWDAFWSNPGASRNPCSLVYHGPKAFSESEVRHLADYALNFQKTRKIDAYVSTHSYSQLILYAYHSTDTPTPDDAELNITGKLMSDAIRKVHGKEYVYGPGATTIYVSSGTTTDWTYKVLKVAQSYTYELRDEGQYGFLLPADQIVPNGEEYIEGLAALKKYIVENFEGSGMGV